MDKSIVEKNTLAIQRLTALWALSESGLGGIFHAFKIPFAGLLLSGIAVIIISLLCHYSESKWKTVTSSLILVLIVKGMVAPHTQITGYIAVTFQALSGIFFYKLFPYRIAVFLFCVIAVLESAFQRLLTLTVLYGSTFWDAVNDTGSWIVKRMGFVDSISSSQVLIGMYTSVYFIGSLFIAYIVLHLIGFIRNEENLSNIDLTVSKTESLDTPQKKKKRKLILIAIFILLGLLVIYGTFTSGMKTGIYIFVRTIFILFIWFTLIGPFLLKMMNKFLTRKRADLAEDIEHIFDLIPYLRSIIKIAWSEAKEFSYLKRWKEFLTRTIVYSLYFKTK